MPNVRRLQRHPSEFQRQGELEYNLVETLAADVWWQRCLWAIDTGLEVQMDRQEEEVQQEFTSLDERVRPAVAFSKLAGNSRAIALLGRYESRLRRWLLADPARYGRPRPVTAAWLGMIATRSLQRGGEAGRAVLERRSGLPAPLRAKPVRTGRKSTSTRRQPPGGYPHNSWTGP